MNDKELDEKIQKMQNEIDEIKSKYVRLEPSLVKIVLVFSLGLIGGLIIGWLV